MDNELKALFGSWDQALGTIISAIGSTPSSRINETLQNNLSLLGNVMQATGNALLADTIRSFNLNKIGNEIQAIGNSMVIVGLLLYENNEEKNIELSIKGNLLQALGSSLSIPELLEKNKVSIDNLYSIYGALLQTIGNSLQAISGIINLKGQQANGVNFVGSWIQAIGAVIQALMQSKK
ncbi:DUF6944 family repetitive protein [Metabacillus sediminilitoris]|uniref:Uncharacterized protein n=1 Tax=Metabacillus sediminilitoris TaxID=2567941 RepID=A0A4S4BNT2_9BACI|nr:hypothetical protein [Metabacillus sediminilitoris]QGQ45765.1 hypothetical protein GMB29_11285 [Metabacillus sediminilitoris]THF74188.1 hypothetical protein E6W99_25650 [Metabacillus sediminilitoris]